MKHHPEPVTKVVTDGAKVVSTVKQAARMGSGPTPRRASAGAMVVSAAPRPRATSDDAASDSPRRDRPHESHAPARRRQADGARGVDRLTAKQIESARPRSKLYKLSDGRSLYCVVTPAGGRLWWFDYRHAGKRKTLSLGEFPAVSLARARERRDEARRHLAEGRDPMVAQRDERTVAAAKAADTFGVVYREFMQKQKLKLSPAHYAAVERRYRHDLSDDLDNVPVSTITTPMLLETLREVEDRGAHECAHRARILASQVFRHAITTGRIERDPAATLADALARPERQNRAAFKSEDIPTEMPELFRKLAEVQCEAVTRWAFLFQILTAARPGEARFAQWSEISDDGVWRIAAEKMKMRRDHVVPLSREALRIVELAKPLRLSDSPHALLFPGFTRKGHGALSENAFTSLLARCGFHARTSAHGFRAVFSTYANETLEAPADVVELCLAHRLPGAGVRADYNRGTYLQRRRDLLQQWAGQCVAWGMRVE